MNVYTLNTHHTYLNIPPILTPEDSSSEMKVVVIDKDNNVLLDMVIRGIIKLTIAAGENKVSAYYINKPNEVQEEIVIVEDAVKFGGGKINDAFVFDDSPWAFFSTRDRLYMWNRDSKLGKVEYGICPSKVTSHGGKCPYFVFQTKNDYSIFNVEKGIVVKQLTDYIYSNDHLVIYGKFGNVTIYDYVKGIEIRHITDQFSFGKKFYFIEDHVVKALNLKSSYVNIVPGVENLKEKTYRLHGNDIIVLTNDSKSRKEYDIYTLGNGEQNIVKYQFYCDYFIESYYKNSVTNAEELMSRLRDAEIEVGKISSAFPEINIDVKLITYSIINKEIIYDNKKSRLCIMFEKNIHSKFGKCSKELYRIFVDSDKRIDLSKGELFTKTLDSQIKKDPTIYDKSFGQLLCTSISEKYTVFLKDDQLYMHTKSEDNLELILEGLYNACSYRNAYFGSDGKSIIMVKDQSTVNIANFNDLTETEFRIDGGFVATQGGINGYRPELEIKLISGAQPRWRNPISLNYVLPDDMSNHIYRSPDTRFEASTEMRTRWFNRLTGKEISQSELNLLRIKYINGKDDSEHIRLEKRNARKSLFEEYGDDLVLSKSKLMWERIFSQDENLSTEIKEERKKSILKDEKERYIEGKNDIVSLIIDRLGYVQYKNTSDEKYSEILIGRNVWFLNYVSFSFDSKYLAFAAKMDQDDFRHSMSGVFVLYNLETHKEIVRFDEDNTPCKKSLQAVWTAIFNKNSDVAFYDSTPNTYLMHYSPDTVDYVRKEEIENKNFLCFSYSGRYMALSQQAYIDYQHHPDIWGHQPCGHIFIRSVDNANVDLFHFNDFAEGIQGLSMRACNVASVAFSTDEKRLLAVGSDGVVVVRNLHLD